MLARLLILAGLLIAPDAAVMAQQDSEFSSVIDQAEFVFSNEAMYKAQSKWIGRTVAFNGTIQLHPDFCDIGKPYEIISGKNNAGDPVNVVAVMDHPIPKPEGYGDKGVHISKTEELRFFGTVRKARETVTFTGVLRILPVFEVQLIFRADDQAYRKPVWVSRSLRSGE